MMFRAAIAASAVAASTLLAGAARADVVPPKPGTQMLLLENGGDFPDLVFLAGAPDASDATPLGAQPVPFARAGAPHVYVVRRADWEAMQHDAGALGADPRVLDTEAPLVAEGDWTNWEERVDVLRVVRCDDASIEVQHAKVAFKTRFGDKTLACRADDDCPDFDDDGPASLPDRACGDRKVKVGGAPLPPLPSGAPAAPTPAPPATAPPNAGAAPRGCGGCAAVEAPWSKSGIVAAALVLAALLARRSKSSS